MRLGTACILIALALLPAGVRNAAAHGTCSGGKYLRGGYGIVVYGTTGAAGGTEALAGAMQSDGQCGLAGTLSGNIAGTQIVSAPATGTYQVNADFSGSMTLTLAGGPTVTYTVNWVVRHRQLVGVEDDGQGMAQITAKEQQITRFGPQTIAGGYSYVCYSPANLPTYLLSVTFDGVGVATATGSLYSAGTLVPWGPGAGSYAVNPDGSYTLDLVDDAGDEYLLGGVIDSGGFDAPAAEIAENRNGTITGPAHCIGQEQ